MAVIDLARVLSVQEPVVVSYFSHQQHISLAQSQQLFEDFLGWLWLSQYRNQLGKKTFLFGPLLILDEVWHCFILHTRLYYEFCEKYWGHYLHHDVEPPGYEHQLDENEVREFIDDCLNHLGEAWVMRRFAAAL